MGLGTVISNFGTDQARSKPQIALIFIVTVILLIIFSQRLFGITDHSYIVVVVSLITVIMSVIITSTFMHTLNLTDNRAVHNFSNLFNAPGSKNFFAVFMLLLYVIRIYELPVYDNSYPQPVLDKILFGHNNFFSNRMLGILVMFGFAISTGYMIHSTTREMSE